MGTAANEQSVMYAAGEAQSQSLAKKKAGEAVDAKLKAEVTFGFDPNGRFVMKTIKNPTPDMIKAGSTEADMRAAQEAPREDAAAGMALAQQNEDVRSQIDRDKEASAMRLLELRRQKIDRMKNNFNGNWWERRRAARDMGANFFTSMIDATRVGTTIAPEEANRQYEELKTRKEIAALEEAEKAMPREAGSLAVERNKRAELGQRRAEFKEFSGADNLALYGTYENALAKLDAFNADRGRETSQWERDDLEAAYRYKETKGQADVLKSVTKNINSAKFSEIAETYDSADAWKAAAREELGTEDLPKGMENTIERKFAGAQRWRRDNAPKPEKEEKPPKVKASDPVDYIIERGDKVAADTRLTKIKSEMDKNVQAAALIDAEITELEKKVRPDGLGKASREASAAILRKQILRDQLSQKNTELQGDRTALLEAGFGGKPRNGLKQKPAEETFSPDLEAGITAYIASEKAKGNTVTRTKAIADLRTAKLLPEKK